MNRILLLLLGLATGLSFPGALRSQTFTNGQAASGVIGQTSLTSPGPSNLPNRTNSPRGTVFDAVTGKVYVVDSFNHRVLRFSGAATAQAGAMPEVVLGQANFTNNLANRGLAAPTDSTLNFPRAALVDSQGRLWIADGNNNRVLRFDNAAFLGNGAPASAVLGQAGFATAASGTTSSTMNGPHGLALGSNDALWVADRFNHRVLRFNSVSGKPNGASADLVLGQPNLTSGTSNQGGTAGASTLREPVGLALDASDSLWVADSQNHRVLRYPGASAIAAHGVAASQVFGQANLVSAEANRGSGRAANSLSSPLGVVVDRDGSLWVADSSNARVLRFRNATAMGDGTDADLVLGQADFVSAVFAVSSDGMIVPVHVEPGPGASLLMTDFGAHRVTRYDPVNRAPTIRLTGPKRITTTQSTIALRGTAADSDGSVASVRATVNNKPVNAAGTTSWSLRARLKSRRNRIKLRCLDDLGLSSTFLTATVTKR